MVRGCGTVARMSRRPDAAARRRLQDLWNDLADFELADTDAALLHALEALGALVRAGEATWLALVRLAADGGDRLGGWRIRARLSLACRRPGDGRVTPAPPALPFDDHRPDAAILNRSLRATSRAARVVGTASTGRAICVTFRVTADAASSFLWRAPEGIRFTAANRDLLAYGVRGLKWFHRRALVSRGLMASRAPFTAAERAVLRALLLNLAQPAVASRLRLPRGAVKAHVRAIEEKAGVAGPLDLLALWDGQSPAGLGRISPLSPPSARCAPTPRR